MTRQYINYRWEPANKRKGDHWHFLRDIVYSDMPWRGAEEQSLATVTYQSDSAHHYWGKWIVNIRPVTPALNQLRLSEIPTFSSKDDAMAWTTAMIRMTL